MERDTIPGLLAEFAILKRDVGDPLFARWQSMRGGVRHSPTPRPVGGSPNTGSGLRSARPIAVAAAHGNVFELMRHARSVDRGGGGDASRSPSSSTRLPPAPATTIVTPPAPAVPSIWKAASRSHPHSSSSSSSSGADSPPRSPLSGRDSPYSPDVCTDQHEMFMGAGGAPPHTHTDLHGAIRDMMASQQRYAAALVSQVAEATSAPSPPADTVPPPLEQPLPDAAPVESAAVMPASASPAKLELPPQQTTPALQASPAQLPPPAQPPLPDEAPAVSIQPSAAVAAAPTPAPPPPSVPPPPPPKKAPPPQAKSTPPPTATQTALSTVTEAAPAAPAAAPAAATTPQPAAPIATGTNSTSTPPGAAGEYWSHKAAEAVARGEWRERTDPKTNRRYFINPTLKKTTWNLEWELYNNYKSLRKDT